MHNRSNAHTTHMCTTHTCSYIPTQWTIIIYTSVASSKYSGIISLRNELIKGGDKEAKKSHRVIDIATFAFTSKKSLSFEIEIYLQTE